MLERRRRPNWFSAATLSLLVFFLYGLFGFAAIGLTRQGGFLPTVWPSSALALVLMLRLRRGWSDDSAVALAALGASLGLNLLIGMTPAVATAYALIALATLLCQVAIARRFAPRSFPNPADGWRFALIVGLPAPIAGAVACAGVAEIAGHPQPFGLGGAWLCSQVLGFLLIAPFGMTVSRKTLARLELERRVTLAVSDFALVAVATALVFSQNRYPLLFLLMPPLLLATFHFRLAGAALGAGAVAAIAVIMTEFGRGPVMLIPDGPERIMVLQIFVTAACLTMLPVAAALNQRDRLSAVIDRQRRAAIEASEAKSQLLAHVSHEVRSPLSAILNFSAFVEAGVSPEQLAEFAGLIQRNGQVLKALSDDLLDLRAQETGAFSIRIGEAQIGEVLDDIRTSLAPQAEEAATKILIRPTAALAESVLADPRRYRQILTNLTSNAIKYGAGHGPVTVVASHLPDDFLRVEIVNGGPGIPPERQAELFLPFSRAGAEDGEQEGAGLGLLLTKQLVEMQGGRIAFESEPNRRTRFWVDLPLAA